ncbi:MAG: response regulator [Candidatus Aminicenantes bacterium]|nr:response regulator [Candidatus Aminicenantes bacterium]
MDSETSYTILVVDDDEQVLKSLRIWLRNEGFRTETALDKDSALNVVKSKKIDVALVDLRMIKENGLNISQKIKNIDDKVKIIILTGYPSFDTAVEAMKIGVFDYLSKGSSNEKIMGTIRKAIAEKEKDSSPKKTNFDGITVFLFCDHSLIKERLENMSENSPVFRLVKTFPNIEQAKMKTYDSRETDIALVCASCNLKNPKESPAFFAEIFRFFPGIKPVVINENYSNKEKVEFLKLGVKGFASRLLSSKKLEDGLQHVQSGGFLVDQRVVNLSLQNLAEDNTAGLFKAKKLIDLTGREIEILKIMSRGLKNREIAEKLEISEKTVKTHLNRIFKKLGVNSRSKAILTLMEKKII